MIYLATPYSHEDSAIREYRFQQVNKAAAHLMHHGMHVFSPISHSHPIAKEGDLPTGWDYWEAYDKSILEICKRMIILTLNGWENSDGVKGEFELATTRGIPVGFMCPETYEIDWFVEEPKCAY